MGFWTSIRKRNHRNYRRFDRIQVKDSTPQSTLPTKVRKNGPLTQLKTVSNAIHEWRELINKFKIFLGVDESV